MYNILTQCPLFRGMTEREIREALPAGDLLSVERYAPGEMIIEKDTAYSGLLILLSGKAKGEVTYHSGKVLRMETIEAPQLIAPAFLFGGYNRIPVDVIAETAVEILTLHRGRLFELMQENTIILSNFIDIISNRANVWSKKIYLLSFESLREKVASYLLDNSTPAVPAVPVPEVAEIAQFFAATRSALQTVLDGLEKKGIIRLERGAITILNRRALEEIIAK